MSKMLSIAGLGLLTACMVLATPSFGNAQTCAPGYPGYAPVGVPGYAPGYGSYGPGYLGGAVGVTANISGYLPTCAPGYGGYGPGYGGYGYQRGYIHGQHWDHHHFRR